MKNITPVIIPNTRLCDYRCITVAILRTSATRGQQKHCIYELGPVFYDLLLQMGQMFLGRATDSVGKSEYWRLTHCWLLALTFIEQVNICPPQGFGTLIMFGIHIWHHISKEKTENNKKSAKISSMYNPCPTTLTWFYCLPDSTCNMELGGLSHFSFEATVITL